MMEILGVMVVSIMCLVGFYKTTEFFHEGLNELLKDQFGVDTLDEYKEMMLNDI